MKSRRGFLRDLARAAAPAPRAEPPSSEPRAEVRVETAADLEGRQMSLATGAGLSPAELERYSRQLVLPEWSEAAQMRVRDASVMVIGAGALGSPVAAYLAGAGVGRLAVVDDDTVAESDVHRQPLHYTPDVGIPKVHSAVAKLRFLNPEVLVDPYQVRLDENNADALIADEDLVVDCSDSFATRYALNAACCRAGVPLVEGGVTGFEGLVMTILPGRTACYRCAFPTPPPPDAVPACAEAGVLGPGAGLVGSLQALEALKLLGELAPLVTDAFLSVDLRSPSILRVAVARRADCPDCGG